jgi:hypothetical protein
MTKKFSIIEAQEKLDAKYPYRFKLITYGGFRKKCNFIWLETNDIDSAYYFRLFSVDDPKTGRFPPSKRQDEFNRRKRTIEYRKAIVKERCVDEAELIAWDPKTYKVTIRWNSGEENCVDWRHIIDNRKERVFPLSTERERIAHTILIRYGTLHPSQNRDIALKIAKSANKTQIKFHWKTNEELVCQGSYEVKVVEFLNINQIDFQWQSKIFTLPSGKTYRPDLYLVQQDLWVEIKGYFRDDAKAKWEEFSKLYKNSELWDRKYLRNHKIIRN